MGIDAEMFVKTRQGYTPDQVRAMAVDLSEAFYREPFLIAEDLDLESYDDNGESTLRSPLRGMHAINLVSVYHQDGDDVHPEPGEQLLELSLFGRYYGEGYERGPLHLFIAIAEWLEARIPDARVFYGGDSSGVVAEPFDRPARDRLWKHFVEHGHRPYNSSFSFFGSGKHKVTCEFCRIKFTSCGGGRDRDFLYCDGCGKKVVAFADGSVVVVPRGKEFHEVPGKAA